MMMMKLLLFSLLFLYSTSSSTTTATTFRVVVVVVVVVVSSSTVLAAGVRRFPTVAVSLTVTVTVTVLLLLLLLLLLFFFFSFRRFDLVFHNVPLSDIDLGFLYLGLLWRWANCNSLNFDTKNNSFLFDTRIKVVDTTMCVHNDVNKGPALTEQCVQKNVNKESPFETTIYCALLQWSWKMYTCFCQPLS